MPCKGSQGDLYAMEIVGAAGCITWDWGSQAMMQQWQFWAPGAATKGASSSVQPVGGTQQGGVVWESTGSC